MNNTNYYPSVEAYCDYFVGIEELTTVSITVYPNPMSSATNIMINNISGPFEVIVFDSFGRKIKRVSTGNGSTIQFHRQNLPAGIYMIGVARNGEVIQTKKLIINTN